MIEGWKACGGDIKVQEVLGDSGALCATVLSSLGAAGTWQGASSHPSLGPWTAMLITPQTGTNHWQYYYKANVLVELFL